MSAAGAPVETPTAIREARKNNAKVISISAGVDSPWFAIGASASAAR
jgi:DNA-binding MurR/RpiR family transcriptional regulator